MHDRSDLMVT
jgi:hypothetical protein